MTPAKVVQLQGLFKKKSKPLVRLSWKTLIKLITKLKPTDPSLVALQTIFNVHFLSFVRWLHPEVTQELTDEDRWKRVEDCLENFKFFQEGKNNGFPLI